MNKVKHCFAVVAIMAAGATYAQTAQEVQTKFNEAATAQNNKEFSKAGPLFVEVFEMGETAEGDVANFVKQAKTFAFAAYSNSGRMNAGQKKFA